MYDLLSGTCILTISRSMIACEQVILHEVKGGGLYFDEWNLQLGQILTIFACVNLLQIIDISCLSVSI